MALGLRAAARELGIQHSALKRAADIGRVPRLPDGRFDVDACRVALAQNTDLVRQRSALAQRKKPVTPASSDETPAGDEASAPGGSLTEASRQKEWLDVEKRRLDLEERRGHLVELAPINAYVAGMIMQARDEAMRVGPELRDRLAQESDPIACEEMVMRRLTEMVNKMSEYRPADK